MSPRFLLSLCLALAPALRAAPSPTSPTDDHDHAQDAAEPTAQAHTAEPDDHHDHEEHGHKHGHDDADETPAAARFDADRGLSFTTEALGVLGIQTAEATARTLSGPSPRPLRARVYATGARSLALASLADLPTDRSGLNIAGARLRNVDTTTGDAVLELTQPGLAVGQVVELAMMPAPRTALAVPRGAVLQTATGDFIYRARAGAFLRVPVTLGATDATHHEIVAGLDAGTTIVTHPVETLWLTELRLTKGGGHSH